MEYEVHYPNQLGSDENHCDSDPKFKTEVDVLKKYVDHLEELNSVLVKTVIELQREVEERVTQMENRIKSSAKSTMEAVLNLHEWEQEMNRLINDRQRLDTLNSDLQSEISTLLAENNFLKDQNSNYIHDLQVLLHLIQHARSTGCWEVDNLMFCEVTAEQVFGPVISLDNVNICNTEEPCQSPPLCECTHQNMLPSPAKSPSPVTINLPASKEVHKHCFSMPELYFSSKLIFSKKITKCDSLCCKRTGAYPSRSVDLFHLRQSTAIKNYLRRTPSYEVSHGFCNGLDLHRTYSEPYLYIFDDKIFYYKPCESTNQELTLKEICKFNYGMCQSMDQKLTDLTLRPKGNLFSDHGTPNSSFYQGSMGQTSFNSGASHSNEVSEILVSVMQGDQDINCAPSCEYIVDELEVECSPKYHINDLRNDGERTILVSCCTQTDDNALCGDLQTEISNANCCEDITTNCNTNFTCENGDDGGKSSLILCDSTVDSDKISAQGILINELQTHISDLTKKLQSREEEVEEFKQHVKVLQDQKRMLMIQLDSQGDKLETQATELISATQQIQQNKAEIEQQSTIIKSLQDALVQCKRAFDGGKNPKHLPFKRTNGNVENQSVQTSRSTIVNL